MLSSSPHLLVRSLFNSSMEILSGYLCSQHSEENRNTYTEQSLINTSEQFKGILISFKSRKVRHLLNIAVRIVLFIPEVAEQAARRSFGYHNPISACMSPVAVFLLVCSACSMSANCAYTPNPVTSSFFYE